MRPIVGALPTFASGLGTGPDSIHILSPNLTGQWTYATAVTALVHEFAHCVSLTLNPSFGNRPRWLWESVALYEAGQRTDVRSLPLVAANRPPSIAELNALDNLLIYDVGHSLADFIVTALGQQSLRDRSEPTATRSPCSASPRSNSSFAGSRSHGSRRAEARYNRWP